ncbi:MAG: transporter substrate-binding domain-containing protein [Desulfobacterales bacterium]|nr:transporter substrate-binding domain-containing protein [Desulfobacterales bacterium]
MTEKRCITSILALLLSLTLISPALGGDLQRQLAQESTVAQAVKRGSLKVGLDIFVPWAMKDKKGNLVGFEVDVAKELAKDMGLEIELVPTKWDGIIPALLTGKFDVIIGGMGITPKRALQVNFSVPYEYSGMGIVAHKKKAPGFSSLEDFNKSDVEIAVKLGTTAEAAAKKMMPQAKLRRFQDEAQAYQELRNGNVHAVVGSAPRPAFEAAAYPETLYLPLEGTFTKEPIGFAVRKGDPDTLAFFNSWINLKWETGWLKERYNYWFRTKEWEPLVQ